MVTLLAFLFALQVPAQRPPQVIVGEIKDRIAELEQTLGPIAVPPSQLQAALDQGGEIHLQDGAFYPLSITIRKPGTILNCHGAGIIGQKRVPEVPAVYVAASDVTLRDCIATTDFADAVFRIGRNDGAQTSVEQAPKNVTFINVGVTHHRRKRGIEVNGELTCLGCYTSDIYDASGQDSQGIAVLNSAGNVLIDGSDLSGGSEVLLIGGDTNKMNVTPTNLTIRNTKFHRNLAEQKDGIARKTKTLLELKAGIHVLVQHCTFSGSWKDAQDGWMVLITPRNAREIHDVTVEDFAGDAVGGGFQIMGFDSATVTPAATSGIVIRHGKIRASAALYGGRGSFGLITAGLADLAVDDVTFVGDGSKFIEYAFGARMLPDGTRASTDKLGSLVVTNSRFTTGAYGFSLAGQQNAANWSLSVGALDVHDNKILTPSSTLKKNIPNNTFVDQATFDALIAASQ